MATRDTEAALRSELRHRHGVTTRERLRNRGLTDRVIDGLLSSGRLLAVARGVFVDPSSPDTLERRVAIACAVTGGAACFPTAGELWRFRKTPRVDDVHVLIAWARRCATPGGITLHRMTDLRPNDLVPRSDGITIVSPPLAMFGAASAVSRNDLESMIEQGLDRGNFTMPTLMSLGRRLCRPGREGSTRFAEAIASRPTWLKPVNSDHELRLARALERRGFPRLERQCRVEIKPGNVVHPDLGIPADRFYIEVDHVTWHGGRIEGVYDKHRDRLVRLAGNHVERVTDHAIDHQLDETVEDLWVLWQQSRER